MDDSTLSIVAIVAIIIIVLLYFNSVPKVVVPAVNKDSVGGAVGGAVDGAAIGGAVGGTVGGVAGGVAGGVVGGVVGGVAGAIGGTKTPQAPILKKSDLVGSLMVRGALQVSVNNQPVYKITNTSSIALPISIPDVNENDIVQFNITGPSPAMIGYFTWNGDTHISSSCEFVEAGTYINKSDQWVDVNARSFEASVVAKYPRARWIVPRSSSSNMLLTWVAKSAGAPSSGSSVRSTLNGSFVGSNELQIDVIGVDGTRRTAYPRTRSSARADVIFSVSSGEKVIFTNYFDSFNGLFGGYWTWNGKTYSSQYCNVFEEVVDYARTDQANLFGTSMGKLPDGIDAQALQVDGIGNKISTYTWIAR